jgi:putative membrane protein
MLPWLIVLHVTGAVLWLGGLAAAAFVLAQHTQASAADARAALAALEKKFLRALADPGAGVAILAGIALVWTNSSYYLNARWMQGKLALVLLLIGLHGVIGVRAKQHAAGKIVLRRRDALLLFVGVLALLVLLLAATFPGAVYLT